MFQDADSFELFNIICVLHIKNSVCAANCTIRHRLSQVIARFVAFMPKFRLFELLIDF